MGFRNMTGGLQPPPKIYKVYPWETLLHFRRIRKNDTSFLKMCVFCEHVLNLCVFRKHFVKLCVFREQLVNLCVFSGNLVIYWWKFSEFLGKSTNPTLGKFASFSQNSQK